MDDIISRIEKHLELNKPFVIYCKPGSIVLHGIFQKDTIIHKVINFNEAGFIFAPFANGDILLIPLEQSDRYSAEITDLAKSDQPVVTTVTDKEAKQNFENLVADFVNEIKKGEFKKLVASRTEYVDTNKSVIEIFKLLLGNYPDAFRYCFYSPESGLWMGATPEQLLKQQNEELFTVALAGTQLYTDEKTVWEDKEKQEQKFVTDYILAQIQNLAFEVNTSKPYTFRAGTIVHLKTDISFALQPGIFLGDVINTLHPTPAVCGLPKEKAKNFILENERYNRSYYTGFLGELNLSGSAQADLFVNLRCMKVNKATAQLFIGCGITKDSDPQKEFSETVNKSITMRKVL